MPALPPASGVCCARSGWSRASRRSLKTARSVCRRRWCAATGAFGRAPRRTATFKQLLDLEKQLVFGLTSELGIQLTEAERQRILRQGTKNLAAFLAYSTGLEALDRGDYRAAGGAFAQAVRADPSFQQAQQQQQAAEAAPVLQASPGDLASVIQTVAQITLPVDPAAEGALKQGTLDVSATIGDVTGQTGINSVLSNPTPESQGISSVVQASGILRIISVCRDDSPHALAAGIGVDAGTARRPGRDHCGTYRRHLRILQLRFRTRVQPHQ